MDNKPFVLTTINLRGRDQLKVAQQAIQTQFDTVQKFRAGIAHFKKGVEGQADIEILMRDIVGQVIDWIAAYPADRSVLPYTQKSKYVITLSGRLGNPISL